MFPLKIGIQPAELDVVCGIVGCEGEEEREKLRQDLFRLLKRYRHVEFSQDEGRPKFVQQRNMLQKLNTCLVEGCAAFADAYFIKDIYVDENGVSCGLDTMPEWHSNFYDNLVKVQKEAEQAVAGIAPLVKSNVDPNIAIPELIYSLAILYQRLTGVSVTTNSEGDADDNKPSTRFQNFARAVFSGFDLKIIKTFDQKIHRIWGATPPSMR